MIVCSSEPSIEIRRIEPQELKEFYGGIRVREITEAFGAFIDGRCLGVSGVLRDPAYFGTIFEEDGKFTGFMDIKENPRGFGPKAIRAIRAYLKRQHHDIYVQCDTANFPTADRLLRLLGLVETSEVENDAITHKPLKVWKWQHSEP